MVSNETPMYRKNHNPGHYGRMDQRNNRDGIKYQWIAVIQQTHKRDRQGEDNDIR